MSFSMVRSRSGYRGLHPSPLWSSVRLTAFMAAWLLPSPAFALQPGSALSPAERYEAKLGIQSARYSWEALNECDRASATASALIDQRLQADGRLNDIEGAQELAEALPRAGNSTDNKARALADLTAALMKFRQQPGPAASEQQARMQAAGAIERALREFEHGLNLPDFEAVFYGPHLLPTAQQVYDAQFIRALLSSTWLALSQVQSEGAWEVDEPSDTNLRQLGRAFHNAERAFSLVTPWCQVEQFALAYVEAEDVGYVHARGSTRQAIPERSLADPGFGSYAKRKLQILHNGHATALRVLSARVGAGASPNVIQRLRVSQQRNAAWAAEISLEIKGTESGIATHD